ncbi:MAG: OmpA family protein [Nannocystaceae bacterium]|nr:OmpA family protein [Nannocystaceae bacterium]
MSISDRRARSVRDQLLRSGVGSMRINTVGYGSSLPVDSNRTDEGRAHNRRIEVYVTRLGAGVRS